MNRSRSSLFLMELVIAILFFSLASAVCIQMFSKSHLLSARTTNENYAVLQAQNLAECWLSAEGDLEKLTVCFPQGVFSPETDSLTLYFDANWNPCDASSGQFFASITGEGINENNTVSSHITVRSQNPKIMDAQSQDSSDSSQELYALDLSHHIPERRGSDGK